jgi:hypothetical protein
MENQTETTDKKARPKLRSGNHVIRLGPATGKTFFNVLAKVNKKDFGKKVRPDALISILIGLVKPEHITQLQDSSLTNQDRLERDYRAYVAKYGAISKDGYIGKLLRGELKTNSDTEEISAKE